MTARLRFRDGSCAHGAVSSSSIVAIRTPTTDPRSVASRAISSTVDASMRGSEAR
jgi:hypothetical protein